MRSTFVAGEMNGEVDSTATTRTRWARVDGGKNDVSVWRAGWGVLGPLDHRRHRTRSPRFSDKLWLRFGDLRGPLLCRDLRQLEIEDNEKEDPSPDLVGSIHRSNRFAHAR